MKVSYTLKQQLYNFCREYVEKRIRTATNALKSSQESANDESKSTAGDKHDTGKAMMQIEVEQFSKQLFEAKKLQDELQKINPDNHNTIVAVGSLVKTSNGNYYISISAGKIEVDNCTYYAVAASAPIGLALKGLKKGEKIRFNNSEVEILSIE